MTTSSSGTIPAEAPASGHYDDGMDLMDDMDDFDDLPPTLGTVVELDRGSLPFALIHGEALVACASWALGEAGVTPIDLGTEWAGVQVAEEPFVLHDSLCPMTPGAFIAQCMTQSRETGAVVVGVRPVTDTVKSLDGDLVGATIDRDDLWSVASPIVLPADVVAALDALPSWDFAELVDALSARFAVEFVEVPPEGRRVTNTEDVDVLEALTDQTSGALPGDR